MNGNVKLALLINLRSVWPLFRVSIISVIFLQKGKLVLRPVLSEGHYFLGECFFWELLTLVTFYGYFQRFVTFKTLWYHSEECIIS